MKCVVCRQGETRPGTATLVLERDGLMRPAQIPPMFARALPRSPPPAHPVSRAWISTVAWTSRRQG